MAEYIDKIDILTRQYNDGVLAEIFLDFIQIVLTNDVFHDFCFYGSNF